MDSVIVNVQQVIESVVQQPKVTNACGLFVQFAQIKG